MTRFLIACVLVLVIHGTALAKENHTGVLRDQHGNAITAATVTVKNAGTATLSTIYRDNSGTAKDNPFTTNGIDGSYNFYAANGMYDITFTYPGVTFDVNLTKRISLFDVNDYLADGTGIASSIVSSDTLPAEPCTPGAVYAQTDIAGNAAFYFCGSGTWGGVGSSDTLGTVFSRGNVISGATSGNVLEVGNGTQAVEIYGDGTLGGVVRPKPLGDSVFRCWTNFNCVLRDEEAGATILTIDPDAASKNAMYQFGTNYKPSISIAVPLNPRGAASGAYESIVANQPNDYYLTVTDANTDAVDFTFLVTNRMAGATTATFRLIGVSKNASPSGNIDFDCAMSAYTPGTDTYAAHVTTGEVTALLTPATQSRPVAVTTSSHTINGGPLVAGDIVKGSCEVDATATTSAQMTDFRLEGMVLITIDANSISD